VKPPLKVFSFPNKAGVSSKTLVLKKNSAIQMKKQSADTEQTGLRLNAGKK
jgi:hypothetical protein